MNTTLQTALLALGLSAAAWAHAQTNTARPAAPKALMADYIVAVVNQESVTAVEVRQRVERMKADAERGSSLPPESVLEQQVLESLIDERVILSQAREQGIKVDDVDVDRALTNVATQNQVSLAGLRDRLVREGVDFNRFKNNVREQMLVERVREREVGARVRITDNDIDAYIEKQQGGRTGDVEYNISQILVAVPESASEREVDAAKAKAEGLMARVKRGEPFSMVAMVMSEDEATREKGGELGLRPADRIPDLFLDAVRDLKPGQLAPGLLRSGAGFHVLLLLDKRDSSAIRLTQTRARHILLRVSDQSSREAAVRQLLNLREQLVEGRRRFEDVARERSEDGTAANGGDLGWANPGMFVPEFENAMGRLRDGGISDPVVSRFGVHLIQVLGRREAVLDSKQLREQARTALREQKYDDAYSEWLKELRARAYVERREAPVTGER